MTSESSPESVIELDGRVRGRVRVVVVAGDCLYLDANDNGGSDESVGVTLRGVRYLVAAHAYRRGSDGVWGIGTAYRPSNDHISRLTISRPWEMVRGRYVQRATSAAAYRDVLAALVALAWNFAEANADALADGASAADARELSRLSDKRERAAADLADIDTAIAAIASAS